MTIKKISPASITWDEQDQPRSKEFEDLYFSAENGLEESRYVFLNGNDLDNRWRNLENEKFVICETGFGSGLNLLAAAELWNRTAPKASRLHFISTELYPMTKSDLGKTLKHWPELSDLTAKLINNYPALTPGFHRFELTDQISVTLVFDEVASGLSSLCPTLANELWDYQNWSVDAWFLDGFAPSMNPQMWSEELFTLINRLSSSNTSLATFTCAGLVKRGLQKWGFDIEKILGFGKKREMLTAKYNEEHNQALSAELLLKRQALTRQALKSQTLKKQSYRKSSPCWHLDKVTTEKPKHIAIIGAGVAGCTTAEALARRGINSTMFDAGSCIAPGASGNPQAALYARLSPDAGDLEDFCLHALNFARNYYKKRLATGVPDNEILGDLCGLIQLPKSEKECSKMQRLAERFSDAPELLTFINSNELKQKLGINIDNVDNMDNMDKKGLDGGLLFPNSGWINGKAFNQHLFELSGASFIPDTRVTSILKQDDHFLINSKELGPAGKYDAVILCTAMGTLFHKPSNWLPIKPIRGQISFLHNQPEIKDLKTVLCRENYLAPIHQGKQSLGATYELNTDSSELKQQDHQTNIDGLKTLLGIQTLVNRDIRLEDGRAGTRTATPDYLPIVGSLPSLNGFETQYAAWRKDRKTPIPEAHNGCTGLYLNLGYGSRGYVYAPLCAEILASKIAKEPEPVSIEMQRSLHPARFLVRKLSRGCRS